ncbi:hypothetical protein GobsT_17310 [Gemmata obscuriglobus]|nr:hypothetical protein GobsT_17310 [Gemmata obscuriglobus]VTS03239.1 unnamed protein product [Gemmata obscuriglobus UQM 2246]
MKKIIAILVVALSVTAVVGCGGTSATTGAPSTKK